VKKVSVVIPVYNEQDSLPELLRRTDAACATLGRQYEILLIDDGSSDDSARMLTEAAEAEGSHVVAVLLNRNYGQHSAIMAGFSHVTGDLIITLDADLQNPPEEIPRLVAKADEGYDVVGTVRQNRQDSIFRKTASKMINRLIEPTSGKIYINGKDIAAQDRVELRRHIGYVIQQIGLFPNMTVAQNICVVPNLLKYSKEACDKIVHELLELVNLPYEQYAHKYPSEMSGGQQQRIGILRALAASPPIVLMDEPFSALDPMTRRTLQQEVRSLQQKLNKTFVFVTHDMEEALDLADVIIFMDHGRIVQMAPPEEMLAHPASGLIQDFLGKFINTPSHKALTAADFMRTGVYTVSLHRGTNECVRKMQRYNVDTLIVVDDAGRYAGTVSIADIRLNGHVVTDIAPLVRTATPTVHSGDDAKGCFEQLISSGASYLVVLGEAEQVEGIITKTSMASAMAEQLWG